MRTVFRWIHIIVAIPIVGYIYSPFEKLPQYEPPFSLQLKPRRIAISSLLAALPLSPGFALFVS